MTNAIQTVRSSFLPAPAAPSVATEAAWLRSGGWGLDALVNRFTAGAPLDEQAHCIAVAVYHEARGESLEGQLAVARVIMNRAASGKYPSSWCGTVKQPWQFSFVNPRTGRLSGRQRGFGRVAQGARHHPPRRRQRRPDACRPTCCGITPTMSRRRGAAAWPACRRSGRTFSTAPPEFPRPGAGASRFVVNPVHWAFAAPRILGKSEVADFPWLMSEGGGSAGAQYPDCRRRFAARADAEISGRGQSPLSRRRHRRGCRRRDRGGRSACPRPGPARPSPRQCHAPVFRSRCG